MASTAKTPHLSLNQWEGGDYVKRDDFNADNLALDTALADVDTQLEALSRAMTAQQYNVYGLALQDYYEGKYNGLKRALLVDRLDGYADVHSVSGCGVDAGEKYAYAGNVAQNTLWPTLSGEYTARVGYQLSDPQYQHVSLKGYGTLTKVRVMVNRQNTVSSTCDMTVTVYRAGEDGAPEGAALLSLTNRTIYGYTNAQTIELTPATPLSMEPGRYVFKLQWTYCDRSDMDTPYFLLQAADDYGCACSAAGVDTGKKLNMSLTFTAAAPAAVTGTLTAREQDLRTDFDSAYAFVRHNGQTVGVELSCDEGVTWNQMTLTGTDAVTGPDGLASYESKYELAEAPAAPNSGVMVRLTLTGTASTDCRVYDYGVVVV